MIALSLPARALMRAPAPAPPVVPPVTTDPFPADLLAASGDYAHFAAEDAGTLWSARHGMAMDLSPVDSPARVQVNGLDLLDCSAGCYEHQITSPMGADDAFSLWVICAASTASPRSFYIGPALFDSSPACTAFRPYMAAVLSGARLRAYHEQSSAAIRSFEWSRSGPGTMSEVMSVYEDAQSLSPRNGTDEPTDASGNVLVLGGYRNSGGQSRPGQIQIRDVILTRGWALNSAQRDALDLYRQARLSAG